MIGNASSKEFYLWMAEKNILPEKRTK